MQVTIPVQRPSAVSMMFMMLVLQACPQTQAGDWPQILGPGRNGRAEQERLLTAWPSSGPKQLWQVRTGSGFAGVAVQGRHVVEFCREGDEEVVRMRHIADGKVIWTSSSPCRYRGNISSDKGPRCVPLIHDDKVYVFGIEGRLRCLDMKDGREVWAVDTGADYEPLEGYFGVGSTPVISGDVLIVNVGGRDGSAVVGFDRVTGKERWKTFNDSASYSSPIVSATGDQTQVFVVTRLHLISLNPADGTLNFQLPFGARGPTVNGATPLVLNDRIFVSASYGIGSLLAQVQDGSAREIWRDADLLATQYATPVFVGGHIYAVDGRQDAGSGSASLKCIDLADRRVLWEQPGFDYGTLVNVGSQFLFLTCGGELIRFDADPAKYTERARFAVLNATDSGYRLPALSGGRLFIRDDTTLKCLQVGELQQ